PAGVPRGNRSAVPRRVLQPVQPSPVLHGRRGRQWPAGYQCFQYLRRDQQHRKQCPPGSVRLEAEVLSECGGKCWADRGIGSALIFCRIRRAMHKRKLVLIGCVLASATLALAQPRRKIIINEDCSGPGGSNMQTLLMLIQSPQVEVLGITIVSGDQWRDEEVAHTLRLLEIMGRIDIPVVLGAAFPLVRTRAES